MMRTEAEIRQCIQWVHDAIAICPSRTPEENYMIAGMKGQIDVLKWALGEPTGWDKVYNAMKERHQTQNN